jgi:MraZ protein
MRLPFLGRWQCKIDAKRRLTLPAKFRDLLGMEPSPYLVTTVGHRGCLFLVPHARWDELTPQLMREAFQGDPGAIRLRSAFARYGNLCQLDGSGRITLTEDQAQLAGLGEDAVVFGNFTRIEIWNPGRFEQENPPVVDTDAHDRLTQQFMGQAETGEVPRT